MLSLSVDWIAEPNGQSVNLFENTTSPDQIRRGLHVLHDILAIGLLSQSSRALNSREPILSGITIIGADRLEARRQG